MGVKIDQFEVPVCNSFKAKILNDQLCYEVDPNRFRSSNDETIQDLKLYIDVNEDRQSTFRDTDFKIFLDTLGTTTSQCFVSSITHNIYFVQLQLYWMEKELMLYLL